MNDRVEILGVKVDSLTMKEAVQFTDDLIAAKKPSLVATANAEMLMRATHDEELKDILNSAATSVGIPENDHRPEVPRGYIRFI